MPRKKATILEEKVSPREKLRDIGGLFFVLCAMFVFLSLASYDPADIAGVTYPPNDPVRNQGGTLGAELAYILFANLGVAAYVLVFFVGFWSFQVFFRKNVKELTLKLFSTGVAVLAVAVFMSRQGFFDIHQLGLSGTAPGPGGVYGKALDLMLTETLGGMGTMLLVLLAMAISMVLASDWLVYTGAVKLGRGVAALSGRIRGRFSAEEREKRLDERKKVARIELAHAIERQRAVPPAPMPAPAPVPVNLPQSVPLPKVASPSMPALSVSHQPPKKMSPYEQPPLRLFENRIEKIHGLSESEIKQRMLVIEQTLQEHGIEVRVVNYDVGPAVTIYELELAPGTPISKVVSRQDEISMRLAVPPVRIVGPILGKNTVGVEVANPFPNTVRMREFLEKDYAGLRKIPLPVMLGKTNAGESVVRSLTEMPHLLIAGTTGSGKSVCLKSIVTSLVCAMSWEEMKLILIDPKMVELSVFADIPHLWAPVVTDSKKASLVLDWVVREMDERYALLNRVGSRDVRSFNGLGEKKIRTRLEEKGFTEEEANASQTYLPYIVVVIDELADLMMTARKEVEHSIIRISQKARAVGIHLVVATQRPSADVITGLIRSNMPSRIAFRVASGIESRICLGYNGAERLLGKGDMLVLLAGSFQPVRSQCTFMGDNELRDVVNFLKSKAKPVFHQELVEIETVADMEGTANDDLFDEAVMIVLSERGSVSLLQRKLAIGYTRAARLIDEMEKFGIVGRHTGSSAREVLITPEQWEGMKVARKS